MKMAYLGLALSAAAVILLGEAPATAQDAGCPYDRSPCYYPPAISSCYPTGGRWYAYPAQTAYYPSFPVRCYAPPAAQPIQVVEVGGYDNSFGPETITISPGTRVRWVNHGQHRHTVTSDMGLWNSREFGRGGSYTLTFLQPGTYSYYCRIHPREMRATIIVR
jgi:plastocyanin